MVAPMTEMADSGRARPILASDGRQAELRRVALFLAVGGLGLAVDAALFSLLQASGGPRPVARAASLGCATLVTFGLNRRFTFAARGRRGGDLARYAAVTSLAQGFSYGLFLALSAAAPALPALSALLAAAAAATVLSFAGQRLFTFRGA